MKKILTIARKDFESLLFSAQGALLMCGFFLLAAYFFLNFLGNFNFSLLSAQSGKVSGVEKLNLNSWVVENYYLTLMLFSVFIIPLISLKAFAEESRYNTLKLLFTYPLTDFEIAAGKFLGLAIFVLGMYLLGLFLPLGLIIWGDPEVPLLIAGALALLLAVLAELAAVLAILILCQNPISAAFSAFLLLLSAYSLPILSQSLNPTQALVLNYLSPLTHLKVLVGGALSLTAGAYFLSLILAGMLLAVFAVKLRRA